MSDSQQSNFKPPADRYDDSDDDDRYSERRPRTRDKFELTRSNIAVVILVAIAYSAFMVTTTMRVGVPVGGLIFTLLIFALVPTFVAWLAWSICGRSRTAGNVAFHVTLGLILVGLGTLLMTAIDTARTMKGGDDEFGKIVREQESAMSAAMDRWEEAGRPIKTKEMFDYTMLADEGVTARRRETLNKFIAANAEMASVVTKSFQERTRKFDAIKNPTPRVADAIEKAEKTGEEYRELILPLLEMTEKLGRNLLAAIELLDKNRARWKLDAGQIDTDDDRLRADLAAAFEKVQQSAIDVDKQSQLLIKIGNSRAKGR